MLLKKSIRKYFLTEKVKEKCRIRKCPGFDPSISGTVESEGPMDAAVLNTVPKI
jgi:hypothetical protein